MSGPTPKTGLLDITAYVPGKSTVEGLERSTKLSANENVLGSSPRAMEAYAAAAHRLAEYPDSRATVLRDAIAQTFSVEPHRLIFGCGSDEIFYLLCQTFLEPGDNIVQGEHAFASFGIAGLAAQAQVRSASEPNYTVDVDGLLNLVDHRTKLVFLANPANPTGTVVSGSEVRRLHAALPESVLLVLDGAYREFVDDPDFEDGLDLVRQYPNVIMTRTFSKLHGLAGLRVGWGYGPEAVISAMDRIRPAFNVNMPALDAAVAALADTDFQQRTLDLVNRWRPWLAQQFGGLGLECTVGSANFVLLHFPTTPGRTTKDAEGFLASQGLLVRYVGGYGLPNSLRITVGLEEHNRAIVEGVRAFLELTP